MSAEHFPRIELAFNRCELRLLFEVLHQWGIEDLRAADREGRLGQILQRRRRLDALTQRVFAAAIEASMAEKARI